MSVPLDPKPWSSRTIFFGASPDRAFRLAPFTIFDNGNLSDVVEAYLALPSTPGKRITGGSFRTSCLRSRHIALGLHNILGGNNRFFRDPERNGHLFATKHGVPIDFGK